MGIAQFATPGPQEVGVFGVPLPPGVFGPPPPGVFSPVTIMLVWVWEVEPVASD